MHFGAQHRKINSTHYPSPRLVDVFAYDQHICQVWETPQCKRWPKPQKSYSDWGGL